MDIEVAKALYDVLPDSAKEKLINPTATEVGQLFGEITKTVNLGVGLPFRWMNSHLERLTERTKQKIQTIPEERLDLSKLNLTSKIIMDSFHSVSEGEFLEAYSNLITKSLDKETSSLVHPYYSSLLTQLTKTDLDFFRSVYLCEFFKEGDASSLSIMMETTRANGTDYRRPFFIQKDGKITDSHDTNNPDLVYRGEHLHTFSLSFSHDQYELYGDFSITNNLTSSELLLKNLGLIQQSDGVYKEYLSLEYADQYTPDISEFFKDHYGVSFDDLLNSTENTDFLLITEPLGITPLARNLVEILFDPYSVEEWD